MTTTAGRRGNREGSNPIRRKDGRWQVAIRYIDQDGTSKRTTVTAKTQKEARSKAEEVRDRLKKQQPPRDTKETLREFTAEWLDSTLEVSDRKESTKSLYRSLAEKHIRSNSMGALPLDKLTPRRIEKWLGDCRRAGLADSTIRSAYTVLRAILDTAVRDRVIAVNHAAAVKRPTVRDQAEADFLTPEEVHRLLDAASGSRYAPLFELMVNTGLRRGEALALTWAKVSFENHTIRVDKTLARASGGGLTATDAKTEKSQRTIHSTPQVERLLKNLRRRQRKVRLAAGSQWRRTGFVFTTELGDPCDPRNALRAFKVAAAKAGLPSSVGLHTLRHSAASLMLSNGVPLKVVSEVLGHSSVAITGDLYGHVAPDVAEDALARLGAALA